MVKIYRKRKYPCPVVLLIGIFALVSSNVFPGTFKSADTTIFLSDVIRAYDDTIKQNNHFGSFGLFINGIGADIKTNSFTLLTNYHYRNFNGYRVHSNDYSHNFELKFETAPSRNTTFGVAGHYFSGIVRSPGSLTKSEFDSASLQADQRTINRDEKRITQKGDIDLSYNVKFGRTWNQNIQISGYGTIEYFERVTKEFKITTRYIIGMKAKYSLYSRFWKRESEFSVGGELFHQPERKEEYENFAGQKSDNLEQIEVEKTSIATCYATENLEVVKTKLFLALTGRYKHVIYSVAEQTVPSRSDVKPYHAFIPEIRLDYKVLPWVTLFASGEMNFKNPTDKELESPDPAYLYNQGLKPQTSATLKAGIKGTFENSKPVLFFKSCYFNVNVFKSKIDNEIVQYEILGDYYYRNAAKADRLGITMQGNLEVIRDLTFSIGYTFSDYMYKSYPTISWEETTPGSIDTISRDFSGHAEPNVPRNKITLSLAYEHTIGKKTGIFAKLNYANISGLWVDDANSAKTGTCNLVGTMLGADLKSGHFICTVSGGVNNIFNAVYVENSNINSADYRFYNAGSPRSFWGTVNVGYSF